MRTLDRRVLIGMGATLAMAAPVLAAPPAFAATGPLLVLWRGRNLAGCAAWARQFQDAGFAVVIHEIDEPTLVRANAGVPMDLASCHATRVEGYVLAGHVSIAAVRRLLAERPAIAGLAAAAIAPGQTAGGDGAVAFRADGSRYLFRTA